MQSKTALLVFGTFLAINLTGFAGAVVLKEVRGAMEEDRYGGLSKEAFATRLIAEGVGSLESSPGDAMAMEMVAKTESGQTFATMRVAVSESQRAVDMHWVMDFDMLRQYSPDANDASGEQLEEMFGEIRVTQVGDVLYLDLGGQRFQQRGLAQTDFGSITGFVSEPVPGLGDEAEAPGASADPSGFFGVLSQTTNGLTVHKISEGKYQGKPAWRVEASFEAPDAKGSMVFIAAKKDDLPLLVTMKVSDPQNAHVPPADVTFTFAYGDAVVIETPDAANAKRLPATFDYRLTDDTPTRIEGIVGADASRVPLAELDLRVVEYRPPSGDSFGPVVTKALASVRLDAGLATQAGYELRFVDNGDGVLSAGDRFIAKAPADKPFQEPRQVNGTWQPGVGVRFFDHWANAYEGTPGAGVGFAALALAAVALALVRRRKDQD